MEAHSRKHKRGFRPRLDIRARPLELNHPKADGYEPRPSEDGARRKIAYALIALLWLVVAWLLGLVTAGVLPGFYYGTKSRDSE